MMRQIAGAFAEYENARLVGKLRQARERRRQTAGKCEGRLTRIERAKRDRNAAEAQRLARVVADAKRLRRASPTTGERRSLREISAALSKLGYLNKRGQPFAVKSVRAMLLG